MSFGHAPTARERWRFAATSTSGIAGSRWSSSRRSWRRNGAASRAWSIRTRPSPTWVADGNPRAPEIERMYAEVAQHLRATRPDTLLVFTTDQYNVFFESIPIFSI